MNDTNSFNDELMKMLQESYNTQDENIDICLISGEQLEENFVTLECSHKFNYKDMGRANTNILNNQNLTRNFSLNSRNIAINKYSYKEISNKYIHLYKRILSN